MARRFFVRRNFLLGCALAALLAGMPGVSFAQEAAAPPSREELAAQMRQAFEAGQTQLAEGDPAAAVDSFSTVIRMTGGVSAEPLLLRAQALVAIQELESALKDIKEALTYGQNLPGLVGAARNLRAEIYLELGAYDRALRDAEVAVEEDRNNPQYQFNLGKAYVMLGGAQPGEKALSKYIATTDQNPEAFRLRSRAYAGMERIAKAFADIDAAIALDPQDHENYFVKGILLRLEERYEEAAQVLKQAIDNYEPADPELPVPYSEAHLMRAETLETIGNELDDPEAARALFLEQQQECDTLLAALPDGPQSDPTRAAALFRRGIAERLMGDLDAAVASLSEAIDLNPAFGEAFFRRGICFFYLGEPEMALADFEQGAAINYASPRSNLWKGRCFVSMGKYREAIKAFSESVAVSDRYTIAYVQRGLAYLTLGEWDQAVEDFNTAIRLEPENGRHYYYRGVTLSRLGQEERAVNSLVSAIRFEPELVEAYDRVAGLLQKTGRASLAAEYRRQAAELRAGATQ